MSKRAKLRVCAWCVWIYRSDVPLPAASQRKGYRQGDCPLCGFTSYSARGIFGNSAYYLARTQRPWKQQKLHTYSARLDEIVDKNTHYNHDDKKIRIRKLAAG